MDAEFGKIIRNAFQNRSKGDYDAFIGFSLEEAENMLVDMITFINEIKNSIQGSVPEE